MTKEERQKIEELKEWLRDGVKHTCEGCEYEENCDDLDTHDCGVATEVYDTTLRYVERLFNKGEQT